MLSKANTWTVQSLLFESMNNTLLVPRSKVLHAGTAHPDQSLQTY